MAIEVKEWYDAFGMLNLIVTWDSEDPYDDQLSTWTAEDYLTAIKQACDEELKPTSNNNLDFWRPSNDAKDSL